MTWSDIPLNPTARMLRQFSGALLVCGLAFGLYQFFGRGHERLGLLILAIAGGLGVLGLLLPRAVRWLFIAATVVTFPIGWVVSLLVLALVFFGVVTPIALFFRLTGRDALHRHPPAECTTAWLPKEIPTDVRRYYRQY